MAMARVQRLGGRAVAVLSAAALLALLAWQIPQHDARDSSVSLGEAAALQGRASPADQLKQQQKQELELREEERNWGARIEALAGKPQPGAARMQALAAVAKHAGANFEAMWAAGEARMQTLAVAAGKEPADRWKARINSVEGKFRELVAEERQDTSAKEQKVKQIFTAEIKKLSADGQAQEARLRRDEENAETTILAEKKETELKEQLAAVREQAKEKAAHLEAKLKAAASLAKKYKKLVAKDKLPDGLHVDLPAGLAQEVGMSDGTLNSSDHLKKMAAAAEAEEREVKRAARKAHEMDLEQQKKAAARVKAEALAASKVEERKEKELEERKQRLAKESEKRKAAAAAAAAAEEEKKMEAERKVRQELAEHKAQVAKAKAEELAAKKKKKAEARKVRCTKDHCDLSTMDKVIVVNGKSIHQLQDTVEHGHGSSKVQALAMIRQLQNQIANDFKQVTGFAHHQEHILDAKKVSKDTAFMLGQKVELSLIHSHGQLSSFDYLDLLVHPGAVVPSVRCACDCMVACAACYCRMVS